MIADLSGRDVIQYLQRLDAAEHIWWWRLLREAPEMPRNPLSVPRQLVAVESEPVIVVRAKRGRRVKAVQKLKIVGAQ